jgi:hypothetical protein
VNDYVSAFLSEGFSIEPRDYRTCLCPIGTHPKYIIPVTYYSIEYVERARELLSQRKEQIDTGNTLAIRTNGDVWV